MKTELQDILQHYGVKGMHWGKRKAGTQSGGSTNPVKAKVDSIKREHSWNKQLKNVKNMSTKDIQKVSARAQIENDMKRLSKERGVGSKKDKQDYIKRADMTDQEVFRKVQRLRAKSNLKRNVGDATKSQKELAKKVLHIAAPLVLQYALTKSVGKKDVISAATNAAVNLGGSKARLVKNLVDQAKKVKHSDKLEDVLLHLLKDEDTLEHYGVKGMKWGKHKAVAGANKIKTQVRETVKAHKAKQKEKLNKYHDKHKDKSRYKSMYNYYSKKSKDPKNHLKIVKNVRNYERAMNAQLAAMAVAAVAPKVAPIIKKELKIAGKVLSDPEIQRMAKNVAQAVKGSPFRYVDGKTMKNVVGTGAGALMKR